jgi:hypothetical protein
MICVQIRAQKSDGTAKTPNVRTVSHPQHHPGDVIMHNVIAFEFLLCSAACFALGGLLLWHVRLVSRGETSIEMHTNRVQSDQQKKVGLVSVWVIDKMVDSALIGYSVLPYCC